MRGPASDHLVENRAETVDVGRRSELGLAAGRLFGRHVRRRPDDRPERVDRRIRHAQRDTEVGHLGPIARLDQHVRRLQVAMQDALCMSVLHRVSHDREQAGSAPGSIGPSLASS